MMLFSERNLIKRTLEKKARMNRVRDLFTVRDTIKAALTPAPVWTCHICNQNFCDHGDCCAEFFNDYYYRYCPSCGLFLVDCDMD